MCRLISQLANMTICQRSRAANAKRKHLNTYTLKHLKTLKHILYCFLIASTMIGCTGKSEYQQLVEKELAKNIRYDSIFLGLRLGMTSKEFYDHCWDMNRKGMVTNGVNNTTVLYELPDELKSHATMDFYPDFNDGRIYNMRVTFAYTAWAPWNKQYFSDSLQYDVKQLLESWYGGEKFISVGNPEKGQVFVKVDGNRRITIKKIDDVRVKVDITDLLVAKEMKKIANTTKQVK